MGNQVVLKIIDLFKPMFKKFGIDYFQMRQILALKLTMDTRRGNSGLQVNAEKYKNTQMMALLSYAVMGIFIGIFSMFIKDIYMRIALYISYVMVLMTLTMVSDFSNVLLDVKEKMILHTRPVDPKAISTAKVIHILNYMILYTLALMLPSIVITGINDGILALVLLCIALILVDFLVVFITSILYVLILKTFDGEKLKDIISLFQIALGVLVMVGYQLFNNSLVLEGLSIVITPKWYHVILPQMWYASWFMSEHTVLLNILRILSVTVPVCLFIFYTKVLSKRFENYISKLEESGEKVNIKKVDRKRNRVRRIGKIITRNKHENSAFQLAMTMLSKDRKVKVMMLPTMTLGAVLPIIIVGRFILEGMEMSRGFAWMYMSVALIGTFSLYLSYSENHKGSWIFDVIPVKNYKDIHRGVQKAFVVKYVLPFALIPSIAFIAIDGISVLPHLFIIITLMIIVTRIVGLTIIKDKPFSKELTTVNKEKSKLIGLNLSIFAISGIFGGIHYFIAPFLPIIGIIAVSCILVNISLWRMK